MLVRHSGMMFNCLNYIAVEENTVLYQCKDHVLNVLVIVYILLFSGHSLIEVITKLESNVSSEL